MKKNTSLIFAIFSAILLPVSANAENYDFYVDKSYDGEEDGSFEKPFDEISEAIKKALENGKDSRKIYVRNGEYEEILILGDSVELFGENRNKTVIKNLSSTLNLQDNNLLKNITVFGGYSGITIAGKAEIDGCVIKNASKNAINMLPGSGKVVIKKTKISGNGKGMYIQTGRRISILDNEIYDNREEGVDLRDGISGTVAGNSIYDNRESGIELIVGNADLLIKDNSIKNNRASGIANQFYSIAKKTGKVKITGNIISRNKKYGIVCKAPSGGNPARNYWNDSLDVADNRIENNGEKAISGSCDVIDAIEPEEMKLNRIIETEKPSAGSAEAGRTETEDVAENSAEEAEIIQQDAEIRNQIEEINLKFEAVGTAARSEAAKLTEEKNKIRTFFVGHNTEDLASLENRVWEIRSLAHEISDLSQSIRIEENKSFAAGIVSSLGSQADEYEKLLQQSRSRSGFFRWLAKLFTE